MSETGPESVQFRLRAQATIWTTFWETVHKRELGKRDRKGQIELIKIYIDTCKLDRGRARVWGSLMCKQVTECAYLVADYLWSGQFYVRVGAGM